ncbi:MAG: cytochrome P450 [Alphaproteobacteria bacterium]|nr:cytochrome P450 [Alphaproteobacteria bacterium]
MTDAVDLSYGATFEHGFPHDFFRKLRDEQPLYWHAPTQYCPDGEGFWVISRYEDCVRVMRDPATFSSDKVSPRTGGGTTLLDEPYAGMAMNNADDPQHRRLRGLVSQGFTPRAIADMETDLRRRAKAILHAIPDPANCEFVTEVARELPLQAICSILGVPEEDRVQLSEWIDHGLMEQSDGVISREYLHLIRDYGRKLIEQKRQKPVNDIMSGIIHARSDDPNEKPLTPLELINFFLLLFPAGAETTRSALSGAMLALIENPDQMAKLRAHPELMPPAVEEIVRWTTPSIYKRRTATSDTEIAGGKIKAGEKLSYWEISANRDERVFRDPFKFDISRDPNPHVGFGTGIHICLGIALARMEIKIMMEEILARFGQFEIQSQPLWMPNNRLLGVRELKLRIS